jgi:hypothetical protein
MMGLGCGVLDTTALNSLESFSRRGPIVALIWDDFNISRALPKTLEAKKIMGGWRR